TNLPPSSAFPGGGRLCARGLLRREEKETAGGSSLHIQHQRGVVAGLVVLLAGVFAGLRLRHAGKNAITALRLVNRREALLVRLRSLLAVAWHEDRHLGLGNRLTGVDNQEPYLPRRTIRHDFN